MNKIMKPRSVAKQSNFLLFELVIGKFNKWLESSLEKKWQVTRNSKVAIKHNSAKLLSAEILIKDERSPIYLTLNSRASGFDKIRPGDGLALTSDAAISLDIDCFLEGNAQCCLLVLEYDNHGKRVGTYRAVPGQRIFYRMREHVARIVPALRCFGVGRITLSSVTARVYENFAKELSKELLGEAAADKPRSEGALVLMPNRLSGAFLLSPCSTRRFVFPEIAKGYWHLEIQHEDRYLLNTRKVLIASLCLVNTPTCLDVAANMGLSLSKRKHLFSYFGGGRIRDGLITQELGLDITERQDALVVEIELPIERYVNINSIALKKKKDNSSDFNARDIKLKNGLRRWLDKNLFVKDARFILYADINLNVVDGSSIWLSSMASILCGIDKCILIAKVRPATNIVLSNVRNPENLTVLALDELGIDGKLSPSAPEF
jgi:hypothetical protein